MEEQISNVNHSQNTEYSSKLLAIQLIFLNLLLNFFVILQFQLTKSNWATDRVVTLVYSDSRLDLCWDGSRVYVHVQSAQTKKHTKKWRFTWFMKKNVSKLEGVAFHGMLQQITREKVEWKAKKCTFTSNKFLYHCSH